MKPTLSDRARSLAALRATTGAGIVRCVAALDAHGGDAAAAQRALEREFGGCSNPPRVSWYPGVVAVERAADRRSAVFAHGRHRSLAAPDREGAYRAVKEAARAALRVVARDAAAVLASSDGEAIARACAAGEAELSRVAWVAAGLGGALAASTGLTGEHAVVVEVAADAADGRAARFADWLAVRANLCGARWLRQADVPAGRRAFTGEVLEAQWSGAHAGTVAEVERRLAAAVAGLRIVRLVRADPSDDVW